MKTYITWGIWRKLGAPSSTQELRTYSPPEVIVRNEIIHSQEQPNDHFRLTSFTMHKTIV